MDKIATCLWFDGQAEAAVAFYTGVFSNSRIGEVMRVGEHGPGEPGSVLSITFELEGRSFIALNGGPQYKFTPAISLFVGCRTQAEIDALWAKLADGGQVLRCGWLTDRFGVSWQIVPETLGAMLRDPDAARAARVMQAVLAMTKLDIAALQRAYERG